MTNYNNPKVPTWIFIISILFSLMELAGAGVLFFAPDAVAHNVEIHEDGIQQILNMWAVRQLALAVIFVYATWKRTRPHLTIAYIFLLVMMLGDVVISLQHKDIPSAGMAGFIALISTYVLWSLHRMKYKF